MLDEGPSILTSLLRRSPPQSRQEVSPERPATLLEQKRSRSSRGSGDYNVEGDEDEDEDEDATVEPAEDTPLLVTTSRRSYQSNGRTSSAGDIEGQKSQPRKDWFKGARKLGHSVEHKVAHAVRAASSPKIWNRKTLFQNVVVAPVACLPAVVVGLLLNVLDALSYGV